MVLGEIVNKLDSTAFTLRGVSLQRHLLLGFSSVNEGGFGGKERRRHLTSTAVCLGRVCGGVLGEACSVFAACHWS